MVPVVNGSFEDPVESPNSITEITTTGIPGWTGDSIGGAAHEYLINGNVEDLSGNDYGNPEFGSQYLGLNAVANRSFHSIESQSLSGFAVDRTLALTVYIANLDGAPDPNVSVTVTNGTSGSGAVLASQIFTAPIEGPYGNGTIDFVPETLDFTTTSTNATISIGNDSFTGVMGIDNVSLALPVPEPAPVVTTLLGCGIVAGVAIRRRGRATIGA